MSIAPAVVVPIVEADLAGGKFLRRDRTTMLGRVVSHTLSDRENSHQGVGRMPGDYCNTTTLRAWKHSPCNACTPLQINHATFLNEKKMSANHSVGCGMSILVLEVLTAIYRHHQFGKVLLCLQ